MGKKIGDGLHKSVANKHQWDKNYRKHCKNEIRNGVTNIATAHGVSSCLETRLVEVVKVRVVQRCLGTDTLRRLIPAHLRHEVEALRAKSGHNFRERLARPGWERRLVVGKLADSRPRVFCGGAEHAEDAKQFVNLRVAGKERSPCDHFGKNAANGPNVHWASVLPRPQQNFRRTVPKGNHLVCVSTDGNAKRASEPKICELHGTATVNEQVLWLKVAVQHAVRVAKLDAKQQLVHVALDEHAVETLRQVHVLFEILVEKLKHQVELVLRMDHFHQPDNVGVVELLEKRDLPDGGAWDTLVLGLQFDFLQGHKVIGANNLCLVHCTVRALPNLLNLVVLLHLCSFFGRFLTAELMIQVCCLVQHTSRLCHRHGRLQTVSQARFQ
eukprot:m.23969 g.23969  ORF g.23969 m.23969 type:complete len:384 (-) comp7346_c0_seq1:76-1227(-)